MDRTRAAGASVKELTLKELARVQKPGEDDVEEVLLNLERHRFLEGHTSSFEVQAGSHYYIAVCNDDPKRSLFARYTLVDSSSSILSSLSSPELGPGLLPSSPVLPFLLTSS